MSKPILQLKGLSKTFGALLVNDCSDLDIRAGETHAIIGPNGAGKSTLIHQISGSLAPDAGHITFDGLDVTDMPMPARALNGMALTDHTCAPDHRARQRGTGSQARAGSSLFLAAGG
jgi:branched-chain amino acid transport system ATP-binding protein